MDKIRGKYCKHVEKKLPKMSRGSIKALPVGEHIDRYSITAVLRSPDVPEFTIEQRLIEFGLDPYEVEMIMLRYVDSRTIKDIVKEQGWASEDSANYFLRKALAKLREGKFSL